MFSTDSSSASFGGGFSSASHYFRFTFTFSLEFFWGGFQSCIAKRVNLVATIRSES